MTVLYADNRPMAYIPDEGELPRTNCKNCGAPIGYGRASCEYCGTPLLTKADISGPLETQYREKIVQTADSITISCEPIDFFPDDAKYLSDLNRRPLCITL